MVREKQNGYKKIQAGNDAEVTSRTTRSLQSAIEKIQGKAQVKSVRCIWSVLCKMWVCRYKDADTRSYQKQWGKREKSYWRAGCLPEVFRTGTSTRLSNFVYELSIYQAGRSQKTESAWIIPEVVRLAWEILGAA